jgi:expansin (peptidoglycan-binding protein)
MVSGRHSHRSTRWPLLRLGLGGAGVAVAVIVVAIGISQVTGGRACASAVSAVSGAGAVGGTATHYVLSGTGNCSYPSPPAGGLYVALSPSEYDGATACGGYVEVSGPDGSVSAEVIDQCPPCASGHIDLSEAAFSRIAPLSAGLVSVTYRSVADPPLPAPVSLLVKEGSSQYWLALLAMNTGNPLALVQVETMSGSWHDLTRADYNYWLAPSGAGPGPFTVRLTDTAGHQITVHGVTLDPGVIQDTGTFMYGAGTVTGPAPAAPVRTAGVPASSEPARRQRAPVPAPRSATADRAAPRIPTQVPASQPHAQRSPSAAPSC